MRNILLYIYKERERGGGRRRKGERKRVTFKF